MRGEKKVWGSNQVSEAPKLAPEYTQDYVCSAFVPWYLAEHLHSTISLCSQAAFSSGAIVQNTHSAFPYSCLGPGSLGKGMGQKYY